MNKAALVKTKIQINGLHWFEKTNHPLHGDLYRIFSSLEIYIDNELIVNLKCDKGTCESRACEWLKNNRYKIEDCKIFINEKDVQNKKELQTL